MNKLVITGRLTKDAEVSTINDKTQVMKFTMAVERDYVGKDGKKPVDFINCEYMGKDFSKLSKFLTKGKLMLVESSLNIDKSGDKYFTKARVNKIEFLGGNNAPDNTQGTFQEVEADDDDMPF